MPDFLPLLATEYTLSVWLMSQIIRNGFPWQTSGGYTHWHNHQKQQWGLHTKFLKHVPQNILAVHVILNNNDCFLFSIAAYLLRKKGIATTMQSGLPGT